MAKVSICIPAYNQVEFLRKTLNSILNQNFQDYEIIISDDFQDNSVKKLLLEFDLKGKMKYYQNNPSFGSPKNWNFSISKAQGEYIKILHHDDFFTTSECLAKFV